MFKNILILYSIFCVGMYLGGVPPVHAYSSILGINIVMEKTMIDGVSFSEREQPVQIRNDQPNFSGYTTPNTRVILMIGSEGLQRETLSDAQGYWTYTLNTQLKPGDYPVSLKLVNTQGESSAWQSVGQFTLLDPEVGLSFTFSVIPYHWLLSIAVFLGFFGVLLVYLGANITVSRTSTS